MYDMVIDTFTVAIRHGYLLVDVFKSMNFIPIKHWFTLVPIPRLTLNKT